MCDSLMTINVNDLNVTLKREKLSEFFLNPETCYKEIT